NSLFPVRIRTPINSPDMGMRFIDFIIASGDLVNADYITPLTTEKDEIEFREVIDGLENIGKPLYYIPGNHDPDTSFLPSTYQGKNENSK
ncbi:15435_t:CDS:2, partial [Dentiscutata heterogama]